MNDRHSIKPYPLRITEDLRTALEQSASQSGRSLNAEIFYRLERSLIEDARPKTDNPFARLENPLIYYDAGSLIETAKHLQETEQTMQDKSLEHICDTLRARMRKSFDSDYTGDLVSLWRGAYASAYVARGQKQNFDLPAIYVTLYTVHSSPEGIFFVELAPSKNQQS